MESDAGTTPPSAPLGVGGWMRRVLDECVRAEAALEPEPVHDLRVALRRCRSMADALARVDPDPGWRRMKKVVRALFRKLGELRDVQVMAEWTERLALPFDPVRRALLERLTLRENGVRLEARRALEEFDRKEWKGLSRRLPKRASRLPEEGPVFESIAVERWDEATWLQARALRSRSRVGWHRLRIGIKRFRYLVENFLPRREAAWGEHLKRFQDLLGDVHDLDLLAAELRWLRPKPLPAEREAWSARIESERRSRIAEYRSLAMGRRSLWREWRVELPDGERLRAASIERLAAWAGLLDPDFDATRHVARCALELFDELAVLFPAIFGGSEARSLLEAAAYVQDVGRSRGNKRHHKRSAKLVRDLGALPGFDARELELLPLVVRYHRGAEPREERHLVLALAGILRLANALASEPGNAVARVDLELLSDLVQVWVTGLEDDGKTSARVASAKHLLERVTGRTFLVRARARRPRLVVPTSRGPGAASR